MSTAPQTSQRPRPRLPRHAEPVVDVEVRVARQPERRDAEDPPVRVEATDERGREVGERDVVVPRAREAHEPREDARDGDDPEPARLLGGLVLEVDAEAERLREEVLSHAG